VYETFSGKSISGASNSPKRHLNDDAVKKINSVVPACVTTLKTFRVMCLMPLWSMKTSDGPMPISFFTFLNASAKSSDSNRGCQGTDFVEQSRFKLSILATS
jgi:hypothetical protein